MALTAKQQAFVEAYAGNATDAARKAGYTGNDKTLGVTGSRLLANARVAAAINSRAAPARTSRVMEREELQAFWSDIVRDHEESMQNRLHAGDSLAKSHGMFLTKVEHTGKFTLEQWLIDTAAKKGNPT